MRPSPRSQVIGLVVLGLALLLALRIGNDSNSPSGGETWRGPALQVDSLIKAGAIDSGLVMALRALELVRAERGTRDTAVASIAYRGRLLLSAPESGASVRAVFSHMRRDMGQRGLA